MSSPIFLSSSGDTCGNISAAGWTPNRSRQCFDDLDFLRVLVAGSFHRGILAVRFAGHDAFTSPSRRLANRSRQAAASSARIRILRPMRTTLGLGSLEREIEFSARKPFNETIAGVIPVISLSV